MATTHTYVGSDGTKIFTFNYEGQPVRVVQDPDDLSEWFLFEDVANILDLKPQAFSNLEYKEKRTIKPIGEPEHKGHRLVSLTGLHKLTDLAKRQEDANLN